MYPGAAAGSQVLAAGAGFALQSSAITARECTSPEGH
jgi:hypothetical protein